MATQKTQRFVYTAKNFRTGLTDVKGQLYLDGVSKAVGGASLTFTELDSTNAPGVYELLISAATLTTWGVAQGTYNNLEIYVNSATAPAPSATRYEITVANLDDIDVKLGTPAGASISADVASLKVDTVALRSDIETATSSLPNILTAIKAIQNNAGFSIPIPSQMITLGSGSNTYQIPITIYNDINALVDPDSQSIVVGVVNQAGADRGTYLSGSSGSPATVTATRVSTGQYYVNVIIPALATNEELIFKFAYSIGGASTVRISTTQIITAVQADGFALQSTLLSVQTTTVDSNTRIQDVQSQVENATYGLSAANTLQNSILTQTQNSNATLTNGTYGLSALQVRLAALQTDVTNNVEGTGFVTGTDSLHAISQMLQLNLYTGGRVV